MTQYLARFAAAVVTSMALLVTPLTTSHPTAADAALANTALDQGSDNSEQAQQTTTVPTSESVTANELLPAIESYEDYNQRSGRYFMGWQFTVDTAKTISQLGAHDADRDGELDNIGATAVALYDVESEVPLGLVQIPKAAQVIDGFAYAPLAKAVTVVPGRTYVVAAEVSGEPYAYGGEITYGPGINYAGYAYKVETVPALPNYRGSGGNNYYGATFRVDSVTTSMIDGLVSQLSPLDTELTLDLTARGPEDADLTWTAEGLPSGLAIDVDTGQITGQATATGSNDVTVTLTSDEGTSDSISFRWTILNSQAPAVAAIDRTTVLEGAEVSIQVDATDDDGALTFSGTGLPDGVDIDPEVGLISGQALEAGIHRVTVTATDTLGLASSQSFEFAVVAVEARPAIESYNGYTVRHGRYFMGWQFTVSNELTISELGAHDSNKNGKLDNLGSTSVALFDGETEETLGRVELSRFAKIENGFAYGELSKTVTVVPGRTYLVAAEISGEGYAFGGEIVYGEDINFGGYAYKVGSDVGVPNRLGVGEANYFGATFRVDSIPNPALVNPGNQASAVNEPLSLGLVLETSDAAISSWTATGLPAGLAINPDTGEISGTPDTIASSDVTISVTNDFGLSSQAQFTWTVLGQFAPVMSPIADATVVETDPVSIQAETELVGPAAYSATGLPAGLSIDETTGLISGRAQPDGVYNISVEVADGLGRTDAVDFQLTVLNWGVSPAIRSYDDYLTRVGNYYMGWQFSVDEEINITELGIHDANRDGRITNRGATTVGLYNNSTGRPIATVEVPADAPVEDGFAYGPLDEPITVEPGTVYIVAAQVYGEPYAFIGTIDFAGGVNYEGYAYRSGSEPGWPNYQGTSGPYYFGATFRTSEARPVIP